ncbi:DUF4871 domain-containing protein [Paenibacillus soyae]|uniref:DUF4871 domain-containing protein n=1 Tax=Paenibacillus soyae TaxID=2969249 RepID=A0A9X2S9S2_9BACL|nr:DUF4871 domain-containing protein [Paenibacillus soyae]MCR2805774.1 DUF4871 domain-containing protein [Paenibacillus soyae]
MRLLTVILLVLLLAGCASEEVVLDKDWKVSPLFESGSYTMIGEEGRIGFIYDDGEAVRFYPNKEQKYMWHVWGQSEEIQDALTVLATSQETGEKVTVINAISIGGPNNGADGHAPSMMSLPSAGLWRLDAYVGEKLYGHIVVEVHENV